MDKPVYVLGGAVWINLANTIHMQNKEKVDELADPLTARAWLSANLPLLSAETGRRPELLQPLLGELASIREICLEVLSDLGSRGELSESVLARIEAQAAEVTLTLKLQRDDKEPPALAYAGKTLTDHARYEVLSSIFDTLGSVPADRIRKCEHTGCILHFVDTSKSGKRRWCSMELCGNRHKAAEFYAKRKKGAPAATGPLPDD
ncbi:CGNR zinc finger domain-containing protein [Paenibacillus hamazuiensis]|uniref:CGNR zinc finger domain-containing protein n=1 Tax=Paenibacillus hamazuiensis TaxID=2936508 RepID=UPI00200F7899